MLTTEAWGTRGSHQLRHMASRRGDAGRGLADSAIPACRAAIARRSHPGPGAAGTARAGDLPGCLHYRVRAAASQPYGRAAAPGVLDGPELLRLVPALVALRRVARAQPAVLERDRGTAGLQPGVGDHHPYGGPAVVAGHGRFRRDRVVQRAAADHSADLGPGGLRRRAPADRPVLASALGRSRLRLHSFRGDPRLSGPAEPHHDRAVSAHGVPGAVVVGRDAGPSRLRHLDDGRHGPGVLHLQRGLRRHDRGVGGRPGDRLPGRRTRRLA